MINIFTKKESWIKHRKPLFLLVFLLLFVLGILYLYFMNTVVFFVASHNGNVEKLAEVKREFQSLEIDYINLVNHLGISYAQSLGFVKAEPDAFVYRQKTVAQYNAYGDTIR